MAQPIVFTSFDEWADAAGLTPEERAEQDRWGATVGERFDDVDAQRRYFAARMAEHAGRAVNGAGEVADQVTPPSVAGRVERRAGALGRWSSKRRGAPKRPTGRRRAL